ncbi:hypothetical protein C8A03DRAFT_44083 [Achaetomium macrosporum]|uniref:Uncharacterized protein n=1 Tax=Achaetomium macrosporum TaxID=79813 RepID=A0AAN7CA67_9PEZI|nr:hypothetical protein C8A03DRAFT_44083 [Achaetomium macrosporum]
MPKPSATSRGAHAPRYERDFELCKAVFGAVVVRVLTRCRRAFPPGCFQLLPVEHIVSRSFEDILNSECNIQHHDKELLRDPGNTIFLRQGTNYGVNRFIGILREDIFPLLENERLVNFRINYLCAKKAWGQNCLVEHYTVAFKYEHDGSYGLNIWRAGTGRHHIAKTDSQLWDLGDYLSRLPSWKGMPTKTEPMHWTLAFHARERPDDPPIGVWKFDRMEFDNANLDLQQRDGYTHTRIASLEIMSLSVSDIEEVVPKTSLQPQNGSPACGKRQVNGSSGGALRQSRKNQKRTRVTEPRDRAMHSGSRHRAATAAQLSPPPALPSSRGASKSVPTEKANGGETAVVQHADYGVPQTAEGIRSLGFAKKPTTKRKPKRPLQLFEDVASSLPATQIIESQSLSQSGNRQNRSPEKAPGGELMHLESVQFDVSQSSLPSQSRLLGGIVLSSDAISTTQSCPPIEAPRFMDPPPSNQQQYLDQGAPMDRPTGSLPPPPSRSASGHSRGMRQWKPQASHPANLIDNDLSDEEADTEIAAEAGTETSYLIEIAGRMDTGTPYSFSPNTVGRRRALFQDMPDSSDDDQ